MIDPRTASELDSDPTDPTPGAAALLRRAANFRDLGGLPAHGGRRLRHGVLMRCARLSELGAAEREHLDALGIATLCDLRSAAERALHPTRHPVCDPTLLEFQLNEAVRADVRLSGILAADLGAAGAAAVMQEVYRRFPRYLAAPLRAIIARLLEGGTPVLIHCTAGKDRTGFVVACLLRTLGVPESYIDADYLSSRDWPGAQRIRAEIAGRCAAVAPDSLTAILDTLMDVRTDYLHNAWKSLDADFGSFEQYLQRELGVTGRDRDRLQAELLC